MNRRPPSARRARPTAAASSPRSSFVLVVLATIVLLAICLRIRLLDLPLMRDEGEYAYMGQLILQGVPPYAEAHNMKLPGVFYAYAGIFAVLGQTDVDIRLGLLVINAASIVLVYFLGRRLLDQTAGLAAAAAFALLSLSQASSGFTANTEHFVVLPMLGGILLLVPSDAVTGRNWRVLGAGFLLGMAFLMKQHGAAFIAFGGLYLALTGLQHGRTAWLRVLAECTLFTVAAALPFALICVLMFAQGVFRPFWFWTFTYAREYVAQVTWAEGLTALGTQISRQVSLAPLWWLLAGIGLTALYWDAPARRRALFLGLATGCSFLAVCPGLTFRPHYFLMLLPAAALLIGTAVTALTRLAERSLPHASAVALGLTALAAGMTLYLERDYLFFFSPSVLARSVYGRNPFPEAFQVAAYIREHSDPQDQVAVVGSEPEIYFYSRRRAATRFMYTYPLVEEHPFAELMQNDMIAEIEAARPRYLVFVNVPHSWLRRPGASTRIFEWFLDYSSAHYETVGVADMLAPTITDYRWDEQARDFKPQSPYHLIVYQCKPATCADGPVKAAP